MNAPFDGQMREAIENMAAHRAASHAVDRRGWTSQQWADDAERLMGDLDGSVSSLLNGHVLGLIAERDRLRAAVDAALDTLDGAGCVFWACEGPDQEPEDMKTCRVCWAVHDLRAAVAGAASNPTENGQEVVTTGDQH